MMKFKALIVDDEPLARLFSGSIYPLLRPILRLQGKQEMVRRH